MAHAQLLESIQESIQAVMQLKEPSSIQFIEDISSLLADTFQKNKKVILAGNGGSLCDAAHFAEELTGFFRKYRPALPAIALADPGHLTCTANDLGFEWVFSRGIEAFGQPEDVFIGLTTSGNSPNIIRAFETAKQRRLTTVAFLGKGGGKLNDCADFQLTINGFKHSDRVQEAHMAAIHLIIERMEQKLYPDDSLNCQTPFSLPNALQHNIALS